MAAQLSRENLPRDYASDDDSEWLDDPAACALQPMNAAAAATQKRGNPRLPNIEKPDNVSADTHDLVLKTIRGGEGWADRKRADDELVALRLQRLAELRARSSRGGADGRAAALVSEELQDLDGERLTRALSTMELHDVLVVHVHAQDLQCRRGSALLDAAVATLARRHTIHYRRGGGGGGVRRCGEANGSLGVKGEARDGSSVRRTVRSVQGDFTRGGEGGADVKVLSGDGRLSFARLSAVDAGVTARLDVVNEDVLPALLVYRGGALSKSSLKVALTGSIDGLVDDDTRSGCQVVEGDSEQRGGGVEDEDDLDALADEVEDLLEAMGVYD